MTLVDEIDVDALRELDESDDVDRRPAEIDPAEYRDWPDDAPVDHQCVTSGVTSHVYRADREVLGHVVMADLDDVDPEDALEDARALDGPAVVVRSSPGCYHVVGLGLRCWDEALAATRSTSASEEFVDEMADRGRFILRTQPKWRKTGELYKRDPAPLAISPGIGLFSRPHTIRLGQLAEDVGAIALAEELRALAESPDAIGSTFTQSSYETLTDELREVVDHG